MNSEKTRQGQAGITIVFEAHVALQINTLKASVKILPMLRDHTNTVARKTSVLILTKLQLAELVDHRLRCLDE